MQIVALLHHHLVVEMVVEDDPGGDAQTLVLATIGQSRNEDVAACRCREDGQPLVHGGGDKVRGVRLSRWVAAAHGGRMGEAQLRGQGIPKWNSGTRFVSLLTGIVAIRCAFA